MSRRTQAITDGTLILIFLASLFLPFLGSFFGWGASNTLGEKRTLARLPVLGTDPIKTVPAKFESFYMDHFGFRNGLIRSHNWLRYKFFKGATYGKILFGKDNWLFLAKAGTIVDYLGQSPLSSDDLAAWKDKLTHRKEWLAKQGIRYLVIIAPNKLTIYPEKLPDHVSKFKGQTRMDQLMAYMSRNSSVEILDLRDVLREAKKTGLVYHPTDTHWTDRGGFVAYREVAKRLVQYYPDMEPLKEEDFFTATEKRQGDLAIMLGLGEELAEECEIFVFRKPQTASGAELILPPERPHLTQTLDSSKLAMENKNGKHHLLVLEDSFGEHGGFRQYLSEQFFRSVFLPVTLEPATIRSIIEQEKPDVVIEEFAERRLKDVPTLE